MSKPIWEKLYQAAQSLIPPCAIQFIITFQEAINPALFEALNLTTGLWDENLELLKKPLRNSKQPELWIGQKKVLFRISHAMTDGQGALLRLQALFKHLRNEPILPTPHTQSVQELIRHQKRIYGARFQGVENPFDYFIQTKTIKNCRQNLIAKLSTAAMRHFKLEHAKIMIPVDLRRHAVSKNHLGNLSAPLFLNVPMGASWQAVQEKLVIGLAQQEELLQDLSWDKVLAHAPSAVIRSILKAKTKFHHFTGNFMATAIISDLGKINLDSVSTSQLKAISVQAIPVHIGLIPLAFTILDCGTHTTLGFTCSEGSGLQSTAQNLLEDLGGIVDFFETRASKTPNQIAVRCENRTLSYRELEVLTRPTRQHHSIQSFCSPRTEQALIEILSILRSGSAYVPIDPNYPMAHQNNIRQELAHTSAIPNLAYVLFTSGSTGTPKGVMIGHDSLSNYLLWARDFYHIQSDTQFGLFTSLSFDLSVTSLFLSLLFGNGVHIFPEEFSPELVQKIVSLTPVNALKLTPSHLEYFLLFAQPSHPIQKLILGGEQLLTLHAQKAQNRFGADCEIYNEYGPTEATVGCIAHRFDSSTQTSMVPIGKPIQGTQISLLDNQIYISGDCLYLGYLNQTSTSVNGASYKTGDLAHLDNGLFYYDGRIDFQIKIRGFRIEPAEIEQALLTHPMVLRAKVLANTSQLTGQYVGSQNLNPEDLITHLRQLLPNHLIPNRLQQVGDIAINLVGKSCLPKASKSALSIEHLFTELLGLHDQKIPENLSFYQLGGDSLKILELISELDLMKKLSRHQINAIIQQPTLALIENIMTDAIRFDSKQRPDFSPTLPASFAENSS